MTRTRPILRATAAASALALVALAAPAAEARPGRHTPTVSDPLASGLIGPLQLDVARGTIFVSQVFAGQISKVNADGSTTTLVEDAVSGLAVGKRGIAYTTNVDPQDPAAPPVFAAEVKFRAWDGTTTSIADLQAFEETRNPDAGNTYGFVGLSDECAAQIPAEIAPFVLPYQGQIDTNPYAMAKAPGGGWYVADAGANALLKVKPSGKVSVVTVFKPQPTVMTAEGAAANGLPECTVGKTFRAEPVPTDVEVARSGHAFVSLLPGGPEDPSLGARGSVVRVQVGGHAAGKQKVIATGLLGATNLALGPGRSIYVTELFNNRVSSVRQGKVHPLVDLPMPGAIESAGGKLVVSTDVFGNGSIVTVTP